MEQKTQQSREPFRGRRVMRGGQRRSRSRNQRVGSETDAFEQKVIDVARVARVMAGGKRLSFRACVVVGDRKGNISMGVKKGADVALAVNKAVALAKKNLFHVQITKDGSIPHMVIEKFSAAHVLIKPAIKGTGIMAGGSMRSVLELAGITNVVGKILGSRNKINNVAATLNALKRLKEVKRKEETPIQKVES